jgi:hypothetical protein
MEEEVAALVSLLRPDRAYPPNAITIIQVIDNGSGMCKAGCELLLNPWNEHIADAFLTRSRRYISPSEWILPIVFLIPRSSP